MDNKENEKRKYDAAEEWKHDLKDAHDAETGLGGEHGFERLSQLIGCLVGIRARNAVELIVMFVAILQGLIKIVQIPLIFSIIGNQLLVFGMSVWIGGGSKEKSTGDEPPRSRYALLGNPTSTGAQINTILCGTSMLFLYSGIAYMLEGTTNHDLFLKIVTDNGKRPKTSSNTSWLQRVKELASAAADGHGSRRPSQHHSFRASTRSLGRRQSLERRIGKAGHRDNEHPDGPEVVRERRRFPFTGFACAKKVARRRSGRGGSTGERGGRKKALARKNAIKLIIAAIVTGVLGYFMTKNMESFSLDSGIPEMILYGIMEPVIGNLVEHLTAVTQGKAGKIDLAIAIPLGSSIQILLGLIPLAVFFSMLLHAIHSPIPMLFLPYDPILNAILWISSVLVWIVSSDNRFDWLEGNLLVLFYMVFGAGMYAVPVQEKWYQGW
ncbi:hypothetical protein B0H13DRAFT_2335373 [Mycena leptocephala]|nr:hypothetical protein B0H13DRAFT_2335373 [Mycena leptocephala]